MHQPQAEQPRRYALIQWVRSLQITFKGIFKTFLALAFYDIFPGAILIRLALYSYGIAKLYASKQQIQAAIKEYVIAFKNYMKRPWVSLGNTWANWVNYVKENIHVLGKMFLSFVIFSNTYSIISSIAIYGIWRFTYEEWKNTFQERLGNLFDASTDFVEGAAPQFTTQEKYVGYALSCLCIGLYLVGYGALDCAIWASTLLAMRVGITALAIDLKYTYDNLLKVLSSNTGKIGSVLWGRSLAYRLFPGAIVGNMGPAYGHVTSAGIFSGLFSAPDGWFTFQSGILSQGLGNIAASLKNMMNSIFFSHYAVVKGHFEGHLGPTSFQIYFLMFLGSLLGMKLDNIFDKTYKSLIHDTNQMMLHPTIVKMRNVGRFTKYRIGLTLLGMALTSTLIVFSPGGAGLIAFAGDSALGAGAIAMAGMSTVVAGIYGLTHTLRKAIKLKTVTHVGESLILPNVSKPVEKTVRISEPSPTIIPQFQASKQVVPQEIREEVEQGPELPNRLVADML